MENTIVGMFRVAKGFSPEFSGSKSLKVNWDEPGDELLNATYPNKAQRSEIAQGNSKKEFHSLNAKRDWNIFNPIEREKLKQRQNWSPSKSQLLELARSNLENDVPTSRPTRTSTPRLNSRTEEYRRNLQENVEEVDELSATIRKLQLEGTDDEELQDDLVMNDFTTTLGHLMPSILEGTYQERLSVVMDLSRKTEEVVTRKSRRLAKLQPEKLAEMENKREKRRLEWKLRLDKLEKEYQRKPRSSDEDDQKETDNGIHD
jgi:hypothetical protein